MFLSKISPYLRSNLLRTQNELVTAGISSKFTSTNASSDKKINDAPLTPVRTEKATLDKLYKKIEIEVRGNERSVLESYITFSFMAAKHLGITVGQHIKPRKAVHERLTLLKAVHVQKKHRVQYESRTYFEMFEILKLTGSTADTYLEYIQRNLPEGVAMKVTKVELQRLPESITQAPAT